MSKQGLEKIVASLELCKLIPAGEFEDTALVWRERIGNISRDDRVKIREPEDISYKVESTEVNYFPAPTLVEILKKIPDCVEVIRMKEHNHCMKATGLPLVHESSLADCALRLWLMVKGIESK